MTKNMLSKKIHKTKKVHLIGICGAGMSALAILFKELGWNVTGSDQDSFEPIPSYLKKNKITFYTKYNEDNVPQDADLIVLGNTVPLSPEENPEKKRVVELGLKTQSLPEALAHLSENTENILVVGSLGKSTVAGMIAWCLHKSKKDPSYFIGALPLDFKNSSHLGTGKDFVLEGDEHTSSKEDGRSKFLHFNPSSVLLTSALHDHVNIFPTEKSYKEPYKKLVAKIPEDGVLVYCLTGKNNKEISKYSKCRKISYSLDDKKPARNASSIADAYPHDSQQRVGQAGGADWYAENIKYGMQSSFDLIHKGKKICVIKTKLLGEHNIENIIGVGALLLGNKKITPEMFAKAISSFHGIKNRIELKTMNSSVPAYQGFGSSYEKAKVIFDTLHLHFPKRRIVAVFEPYAFSWRNRKFLKWYKHIFDNVDKVVMLSATSHGTFAKDQLTTSEIWAEVKKYKDIETISSEKEGLKAIEKIVQEGDVVALVSSGLLFGLSDSVPKLMDKKFPKKN